MTHTGAPIKSFDLIMGSGHRRVIIIAGHQGAVCSDRTGSDSIHREEKRFCGEDCT